MSEFVISCCSTADLTKEHLERRNIHYLCFHYQMDGKSYLDDMGETMPLADFYAAMVAGADTSTSQINITEYLDFFEEFLKEGKDILHVSFSGGLSGSVNSALNAANIAMERYPERKIYVVDSLCASSGYGLLMDKVADLRDEGMGIEQLRDWVEANKLNVHHWFFSTDLTFYIKGGRVSKTAGGVATILGICPVLDVDEHGHLIPRFKARSKKKAREDIVKRMRYLAQGGTEYADKCYLCHSACLEDAQAVADMIEAEFKNLKGKPEIYDIGTTIGSHCGPGTVALFFWGKTRGED